MKYIFQFDELPPNNNAYIRMHWTVRKPILDTWILKVVQARNASRDLPREPIKKCGIVWRMYVARRRDWDNAAAMFKVVGDALRLAGVIKNDSPVVVEWFRVEQIKWNKGDSSTVEIWTGGDI